MSTIPLREKGLRMTTDKPKNIDEYIAKYPDDIRVILEKIRMTIKNAAPEAKETIKYEMPTFTLDGNLVYFAAFKEHIGFYPPPTGLEKYQAEISAYAGPKGSLKFPLDRPIPYDLIHEIVTFRVKENLERVQAKKNKSG
ncbi:MAG TPA: DUF1801 domain-containing protein [Anaerolineaceae bacterium]|jgi:uncharacterized protein YdhG (YjbR/CyaY superfamily)